MAEARHGTLVPNTVATVTLSGNYNEVMVVNRNGAGELYFTIDGSPPTVGGADCLVVPPAMDRATAKSPSQATTVVKLISATPVQYSVRGVEPWGATGIPAGPTTLAGLYLWFAADQITGLADGAAVASWQDSSGNGRHLTQAVAANQPLYRTNILNGKPVVRFDGSNDELSTATFTPNPNMPYTIVTAFRSLSTANNPRLLASTTSPGGGIFYKSGSKFAAYAGTNVYTSNDYDTNAHVLCGLFDNANSVVRVDGVQTANGNSGAEAQTSLRLGGQYNLAAGQLFNGDFAEVLFYNRALSVAEMQQLEVYLAAKYAITLWSATSSLDSIRSLRGRYAADQISGLADGAAVATWPDVSGGNTPLTQSTGSKQPTYRTNVLNGKPVVRFDGVDDGIGSAALPAILAQPTTVAVVAKLSRHSATLPALIFEGNGTTNRNIIGDTTSLSAGSSIWGLWAGSWSGHGIADLNWHVFVGHFNGANSWLRVDGHQVSIGNAGTNSLGGFWLGSDNNGTQQFLDGDIAEAAVFNPGLNLDQVRQVERALASKWGLTVPSFSPVELDGVMARFEAGNVNAVPDAAVSAWSDTLANVTDASQSTAGSRPVLKANAYQNRPTVLFDGVDDHLRADQLAGLFSGNDKPFTVVVVGRYNTTTTGRTLVGAGSSSSNNPDLGMQTNTGVYELVKRDDASSGSQTGPSVSATIPTNPQVLTYISTGTTATIRRDGVELIAGASLDVGIASMNQLAIGTLPRVSNANFFAGDIAEVVFYNRPLTTAEVVRVEQFLDAKYEITTRETTLPTSLSGLQLWVEADKLSTTDGIAVKTWPDSSGNARHATQATGTKQPLYKTNIINGKPVLRFDGTDDFLADGTSLTLTSGFTMAVVIRPVTVAVAALLSVYDAGAQTRLQFSQGADGSVTFRVATDSTNYIGRVTPAGQLTNGTPTVLVVDYDGGTTAASLRVFRNGVQVDTTNGNVGSFTSAGSSTKTFEIASQFNGAGGTCFNGDFAAALVWLRKLSDTERRQLEAHLGAKYGITVT